MRFSSRCFTARVVSCEMSPHRVAGSLTSRHRSRRVKSVSALTLAMGCISLLRLDGLSFGVGYALLFAGPFYTIHRTLPGCIPRLPHHCLSAIMGSRRGVAQLVSA